MRRGWLLALLVVSGLLLAGVWTWQWLELRAGAADQRAMHARFGTTILAAAEGAAVRACRGGRYDPEELALTLEDVRRQVDAYWLALVGAQGSPIAEAGAPRADGATEFRKAFEPPRRRGHGRGRRATGSLEDLPSGPAEIVLQLPTVELERNLAADLRRFLLTGLALTAAVVCLAVLLALGVRSVELRARLATSHEKVAALEYLGRLGAGLAHETRNPLGVVRGYAERLLRDDVGPVEVRDAARTILEEVDRTAARLDEFLLLSRPSTLRRRRVPMRALLTELAGLLSPDLEAKRATIGIAGAEIEVEADREQARRLLLNLLVNATQAIDDGGEITVELRRGAAGTEVEIRDDGPGVPAEIRESLFEPYVSMRQGGTGLGLAIARQIAMAHHWRLRYEPGRPRGTVMTLEIGR
jgi:signal transduction histidine kinase